MNRLRELLTKAKAGDKASRIALIAPVVAFVFALGWFNSGVPPTQVIEPTPSLYAEPSSLAEADNFATTDIFVHVTGAVAKPGVYAAEVGSRVFDIVAMAGGFTKKADQASVNLARLVSDGEQLLVFERASEAKSASTSSNTSVGSMAGTLVSLNRATLSELEELPGLAQLWPNESSIGEARTEVSNHSKTFSKSVVSAINCSPAFRARWRCDSVHLGGRVINRVAGTDIDF